MILCYLLASVMLADAQAFDWSGILMTAAAGASTVVLAAFGWLCKKGANYFHEKSESESESRKSRRYSHAAEVLLERVGISVKSAFQTYVKKIKEGKDPASPGGTSLTDQEKKDVNTAFWGDLKGHYIEDGWDDLKAVYAAYNEDVETVVEHMKEAAVHDMKTDMARTEAVAASGNP